MAQTLTGTIGTLVALTTPSQDPTTIDAAGVLQAGLVGYAGQAWQVVNLGTITRAPAYSSGVRLLAGGTVTNSGASSLINGAGYGVRVSGGAATVTNSGTISGGFYSVYAYEGGVVTNLAGGTLTASRGVYGGPDGALTVSNEGSILGGTTTGARAVRLRSGGLVTNAGGGVISARYGVVVNTQAATIRNAGLIQGGTTSIGRGIWMTSGGAVTNQVGGTIAGFYGIEVNSSPVTIDNSGVIAGAMTSVGAGVGLSHGGAVTNRAGATISGRLGVAGLYQAVTIHNAGIIAANTAVSNGLGIHLPSGGAITNTASGTISGYIGIRTDGAGDVVDNAGIIQGSTSAPSGYGVFAGNTAAITNKAGGTIIGRYAIAAFSAAPTITNAGLIQGGSGVGERGVYLGKGGVLTNLAGGEITGDRGVAVAGATGTIRNAGTISGSSTAVRFSPGFDHTLIVDAGAVFSGIVNGGNTIGHPFNASTMVMASAASAGTISGLGSQFINFARTTIEAGAQWAVTGANTLADGSTLTNQGTLAVAGGALTVDDLLGAGRVVVSGNGTLATTGTVAAAGTIELGSGANALVIDATQFAATISGFGKTETITLAGMTDAVSASIAGGNTLVVDRSANPDLSLVLDPGTDYSGATFSVGDGGSDFLTTDLACFAAGTRIDTPDGPVPVEALRVGQPVSTADGAAMAVRWIGWRHLDTRRHPDPSLIQPIVVEAGAITAGVPARPVRLSPDHALALDGRLVPVRMLVNGTTIRIDSACRGVTYFHVELDRHAVILAEGLAAESYLDTGNRGMFENAAGPLTLHPDFGGGQAARVAGSCLPFIDDPATVRPCWQALADRAAALGHPVPDLVTTTDPDLALEVDGRRIAPLSVRDGECLFVVPAGVERVRLVSRADRPDRVRPWSGDRRRLGVAVGRISLTRDGEAVTLPLDHPDLVAGWWPIERDGTAAWRWTDGCAALPLPPGRAGVLRLTLVGRADYALATDPPERDHAGRNVTACEPRDTTISALTVSGQPASALEIRAA